MEAESGSKGQGGMELDAAWEYMGMHVMHSHMFIDKTLNTPR